METDNYLVIQRTQRDVQNAKSHQTGCTQVKITTNFKSFIQRHSQLLGLQRLLCIKKSEWSIVGMILTEQPRCTRREICSGVTLSIKIPTLNSLGLNPSLRDERSSTKRLSRANNWNFWIIGNKPPTCYDPCGTPMEWHLIFGSKDSRVSEC